MPPAGDCKKKRRELCAAVYVHVPFCARKCRYCDFYSLPLPPPGARRGAGRYLDALAAELDARAADLRTPLDSIFVGGGTPTVLPAATLGKLAALLRPLAGPGTEWTVEANPGTLTAAKAARLAAAGVNRVSLGAQSFEAGELRTLGRLHRPADIARAAALVRAAGIDNIGLDLIYGIPGQTQESWRATLARALALRPAHLSCYCLSYELHTPLAADRRAGRVAEMPEARQEACYRLAIALADEAGLEHYEISNFALPGRRCRHNLACWHNEPYLGLGPAAASFLGGRRRTNRADLDAYASAALAGRAAPATAERLTGLAAAAETAMLALRLIDGLDRAGFAARHGMDVTEAFPHSIRRHVETGSLVLTGDRLRIAEDYLFLADAVLADIVAEGRR